MIAPYRRYADFEGRSRRSEYWMFILFQILVIFGIAVLGMLAAAVTGGGSGQDPGPVATVLTGLIGLFMVVFVLGTIIPSLALAVRRLHDSEKSGWFLLLAFVPFGSFVLLVFYCLDGTPGPNRYGPDPKGRGGARTADVFS